jgi:catechol 2,3-dioxygenase-like lactoylglutathione lyase family enzyme
METADVTALAPDVVALRPFVPATDFDASVRFYQDLGFNAYRLGDAMASMHLGPFAFLLHQYDREDFATHFAMHLLVKNVAPWWSRIAALDLGRRYGVRAPIAPELQPWGLVVAYVFDPSGVLWHIAEGDN